MLGVAHGDEVLAGDLAGDGYKAEGPDIEEILPLALPAPLKRFW